MRILNYWRHRENKMEEKKFLKKLKEVIESEELECCEYKIKGIGSLCYICIALEMINQRSNKIEAQEK